MEIQNLETAPGEARICFSQACTQANGTLDSNGRFEVLESLKNEGLHLCVFGKNRCIGAKEDRNSLAGRVAVGKKRWLRPDAKHSSCKDESELYAESHARKMTQKYARKKQSANRTILLTRPRVPEWTLWALPPAPLLLVNA